MIKFSHFSYEYKNMFGVLVWFPIESFLSQVIVFMACQVINHGVVDGINLSYLGEKYNNEWNIYTYA